MAIQAGEYSIGLSRQDIDACFARLKQGIIKKEYLASSFPVHEVTIGAVSVGKKLVTTDEFSEFVHDAGYLTEAEADGWGWISPDGRWQKCRGVSWRSPFGSAGRSAGNGMAPVMQVSWNDAAAYCAWMSGRTGRRCRLPREAEWEIFARRCGIVGAAELNTAEVPGIGFDAYQEYIYRSAAGGRCSIGLLWEWTEDWYDRYPGGIDNKDYGTVYKVLRGGSAASLQVQRTREFRLRKCPTARSPFYGFRILFESV